MYITGPGQKGDMGGMVGNRYVPESGLINLTITCECLSRFFDLLTLEVGQVGIVPYLLVEMSVLIIDFL